MDNLGYSRPPDSLMEELEEVARDSIALSNEIAKANHLPKDFPAQQLLELLKQLIELPKGTAEGCKTPLQYARQRIPAIRRSYIITEQKSAKQDTGGDEPPPLTRGMAIDKRLTALIGSIATALDEYRRLVGATDIEIADTADSLPKADRENDIRSAEKLATEAEETLTKAEAEVERLTKPESKNADDLKRQMRDTKRLFGISRVELRMPDFISKWYRATVDVLADKPDLLRKTSNIIDKGTDLTEVGLESFSKLTKSWRTGLYDALRCAASGLRDVADKWENEAKGDKLLDAERQSDFDLEEIHEMVLRGETPPKKWWPWITELSFGRKNLEDIAIFSHFTNLTELHVGITQVSDISALSGLVYLTDLDLVATQVSDVSALSKLVNLTWLNLGNTHVSDISVLSQLVNLSHLGLWGTQITDVSALSQLVNLTMLGLENTHVSDVSALSKLAYLRELNLWDTQVRDITALSKLMNLKQLNLGYTQVSNISALNKLPNLKHVIVEEAKVEAFTMSFGREGVVKSQIKLDE